MDGSKDSNPTRRARRLAGLARIERYVHPEDVPAVDGCIAKLTAKRRPRGRKTKAQCAAALPATPPRS